MSDWRGKCKSEWKLRERKVPAPDTVDWKAVYEKKPFGRNLLKNPAPGGLSHTTPPPEHELPGMFGAEPPRSAPEGDFTGWTTSTEVLPYDTSGIPEGAAVCALPQYSWFSLEQHVDLKQEGLWDEVLDVYQPDICIKDWYEESRVHEFIYQLRVRLLGADGRTVLQEHAFAPKEDMRRDSRDWKKVSHVFRSYGPGVRHVHFLHRLKNMNMVAFRATRATDSAVVVKLRG
ncbi:F-box only protein 50 [Lepisosteus oculatus]|uniref:F-box only protein 50 n=1 Tax=Lepisosteus oculatus TaxID=7918 RepID=UPI00371971E4